VISRGAAVAQTQLVQVRDIAAHPDPARAVSALGDGLATVLTTVAPMLAAVVIAAVVATAMQGGIYPSFKRLKPTFKQFNPVSGMKRLFGAQAWWQGAKSLLKTAVVGLVLTISVKSLTPALMSAGGLPVTSLLDEAAGGAMALLKTAVFAGLLLAFADVVVVIRRNRKKTRMSKHEIKEENKRSEGDPLLKGAIRSKQLAMSRNRMMAAVATADVVLVNPTHVAVALRYEPGTGAPRVVAKGKGYVAARIRDKATEHHVPMVADVALARALHSACAVGQEIPEYLFTAVARVLAFVMALRRRGAATGLHRVPDRVGVVA
jgi:flagellar biosynthetic protein FlhB